MEAPTPKLVLLCNFFAENCMKMKEFGPAGGASLAPPGSANGIINVWLVKLVLPGRNKCT